MAKAAYWALGAYLVLKLLQYFFVPRPGFGEAEPGARQKLLRGEPLLLIVACAVAVPAVLVSTWYFQRGYERGLAHSADCYGKLSALKDLGDVEADFDPFRVARSVTAARQSASLAAESLDLPPDAARGALAERLRFYTRRYPSLSRRGDRRAMRAEAASIERCMSEPLISF